MPPGDLVGRGKRRDDGLRCARVAKYGSAGGVEDERGKFSQDLHVTTVGRGDSDRYLRLLTVPGDAVAKASEGNRSAPN